jgi:hypothetical protein
MASSCRVFQFLSAANVHVLQSAQSENGDHITVTVIIDSSEVSNEDGR